MTISRPCYCTREGVKNALDFKETARADARIDRAIESGSEDADRLLHRRFYPWTGTRYFDWPNESYSRPWRLWLDSNELISVSSLVVAGVTIPPTDYFLRRSDGLDEPPYTYIEIDLSSSAAFTSGATWQRAIAIAGEYGHSALEQSVGVMAEALDSSETGVDVTDSSLVGVGDLIRVDDERMLITGKSMLDTAVNATNALVGGGSGKADKSITLSTPTGAPQPGETILIDSERMLVVDLAGSTITVERAYDGSTLGAHDVGADIYAPRALTVVRGAVGTTAATHTDAAAVARHVPPGPVRDLSLAEALGQLQQEASGYARPGGVEDNARNNISVSNIRSSKNDPGVGVEGLRQRVYGAYGRKARIRAV